MVGKWQMSQKWQCSRRGKTASGMLSPLSALPMSWPPRVTAPSRWEEDDPYKGVGRLARSADDANHPEPDQHGLDTERRLQYAKH
jgi:hypothetical protein